MRKLWRRYKSWKLPTQVGVASALLAPLLALLLWRFPSSSGSNIAQEAGDNAVQIAGDLNLNIAVREELGAYRKADQIGDTYRPPSASDSPEPIPEPKIYLDPGSDPQSILTALKPFDQWTRPTQTEAHFHGKWIRDPGWSLVVASTPQFWEHSGDWKVTLRHGTPTDGVTIFALNSDPSLSRWRPGDRVVLHGQIREVRLNPFIYVQLAALDSASAK